jgi:membrane protein YdbS with pleckstrin-like domain
MTKNIGKTDMIVRLVLAAVLVILYFFVGRITGLIFIVIAIILALTAVLRICPLYYIFRTDTLEKKV